MGTQELFLAHFVVILYFTYDAQSLFSFSSSGTVPTEILMLRAAGALEIM